MSDMRHIGVVGGGACGHRARLLGAAVPAGR